MQALMGGACESIALKLIDHLEYLSPPSHTRLLPSYELTHHAAPKGVARVEVTFLVSADNVLTATATDLNASRHEEWLKRGCMRARRPNFKL